MKRGLPGQARQRQLDEKAVPCPKKMSQWRAAGPPAAMANAIFTTRDEKHSHENARPDHRPPMRGCSARGRVTGPKLAHPAKQPESAVAASLQVSVRPRVRLRHPQCSMQNGTSVSVWAAPRLPETVYTGSGAADGDNRRSCRRCGLPNPAQAPSPTTERRSE